MILNGPSSGNSPVYSCRGRTPDSGSPLLSPSVQISTLTLRLCSECPLRPSASSSILRSSNSTRAVCFGFSNCFTNVVLMMPPLSKNSLMSSSVACLSIPLIRTARGAAESKSAGSMGARSGAAQPSKDASHCQTFSGCGFISSTLSRRSWRLSSDHKRPVSKSRFNHRASVCSTKATPSRCTLVACSRSSHRTQSTFGWGNCITPDLSSYARDES
mmetsp:Transcript_121583/g.192446  ORF Transcript_121583/g.192446 Transcript_121583/m.192446 type:complete len:216 (-) Transcript_121583:888-1535(-)